MIKQNAFGTALEHPVPRKMSDDRGSSAFPFSVTFPASAISLPGMQNNLQRERERDEKIVKNGKDLNMVKNG